MFSCFTGFELLIMDRRTFFGAAGSAGAIGLLPSSVLGNDSSIPAVSSLASNILGMGSRWTNGLWWKEITFSLSTAKDDPPTYPKDKDGSPYVEYLRSQVTWYCWPQDRIVLLKYPIENPRFEGEVQTILLPTFDMRLIARDSSIWDEIRSAIRAGATNSTIDHRYCSVVEIDGMVGEFGICCGSRPMRPVTNNWEHRDQNTDCMLARRKKNLIQI